MVNNLLLLKQSEIEQLFRGKTAEIIKIVSNAYLLHHQKRTSLPFSQFLRFPDNSPNRIIALPAYLGQPYEVAGLKWIASFPENIAHNLQRTSAIIVLNSMQDGSVKAILEGSVISRLRTASSAVLAIDHIYGKRTIDCIGLVGCGMINFEIIQTLAAIGRKPGEIHLYDIDARRATDFSAACKTAAICDKINIAGNIQELLSGAKIISFATTAPVPYVNSAAAFQKGSLILHISLRDLSPNILLDACNIVDDREHVLREKTSLHLAEQIVNNQHFIRATIGELITGRNIQLKKENLVVFSPFGLGVLDLALADFAYKNALQSKIGQEIPSFFSTVNSINGSAN